MVSSYVVRCTGRLLPNAVLRNHYFFFLLALPSLECGNGTGCIITSPNKDETMKVQDNSIIINCDGFYLISLKGYFSEELSLSLYYRKGRKPLFSLSKVKSVDSIGVAHLAFKDKVYFNVTTHNTSYKDIQVNGGELIVILQTPGGFCAY